MAAFCENCGSPLAADDAFCQSCGTRVPDSAAPTQASHTGDIEVLPSVTDPAAADGLPATVPGPTGRPRRPDADFNRKVLVAWVVGLVLVLLAGGAAAVLASRSGGPQTVTSVVHTVSTPATSPSTAPTSTIQSTPSTTTDGSVGF